MRIKFVIVLLIFVCSGLLFFIAPHAHAQPRVGCNTEACDNTIGVNQGCNQDEVVKNQKTVFDSKGVAIGVLKLFFSGNCNAWWGALNDNSSVSYSLQTSQTIQTGTDAETYNGGGVNGPCPPHITPGYWCTAGMAGSLSGACYHAHSVITDEYLVQNITTNTNTFCV